MKLRQHDWIAIVGFSLIVLGLLFFGIPNIIEQFRIARSFWWGGE